MVLIKWILIILGLSSLNQGILHNSSEEMTFSSQEISLSSQEISLSPEEWFLEEPLNQGLTIFCERPDKLRGCLNPPLIGSPYLQLGLVLPGNVTLSHPFARKLRLVQISLDFIQCRGSDTQETCLDLYVPSFDRTLYKGLVFWGQLLCSSINSPTNRTFTNPSSLLSNGLVLVLTSTEVPTTIPSIMLISQIRLSYLD